MLALGVGLTQGNLGRGKPYPKQSEVGALQFSAVLLGSCLRILATGSLEECRRAAAVKGGS
jgi:hypothetical protein